MFMLLLDRVYYDPAVISSVCFVILAVRSSLSQLKGLPSMARLRVLASTMREDLAIGEALQPDVEEEPSVAFVGGVAALEAEGDGWR